MTASVQAPPERTGDPLFQMRTQPRPLRVVYAAAPAVLACAALPEAYRTLLRDGAGLAIGLAVGGAAVADGAGEGGNTAVVAAVSGHSRSLE